MSRVVPSATPTSRSALLTRTSRARAASTSASRASAERGGTDLRGLAGTGVARDSISLAELPSGYRFVAAITTCG